MLRVMDTGTVRRGFEILLGRPLGGFDAGVTYAAYLGGPWPDEVLLDAQWLTPAGLRRSGPARIAEVTRPVVLDASRFGFEADVLEGVFGEAFVRDLRAVGDDVGEELVVHGRDLAAVLERHGVDLRSPGTREQLEFTVTATLLLPGDGTLAGAMHAALDLDHPLPQGPYEQTAAPRWEEALAVLGDDVLRDHLRMHCLTAQGARAYGAQYLGRQWPVGPSRPYRGATLLAGFEIGESQTGVVVVALEEAGGVRAAASPGPA
jgi:hypothetical protein